ncbi:hypothetical protein MUY35_02045 [Aliiroseovarius sp. S1339]|uniref:hypothetical protein n=1 Tax=Aliiroseovarius sp. S1339 TaxID=2936990 RepID=UPI0020BE55D1|nr:hypothetical protein [Aliiroseovarius sp. S1339]MCK8462631.1 hypothetical protein [Aliiroseovarius sp. S1339]
MIFRDPARQVGWKRFAPLVAVALWGTVSLIAIYEHLPALFGRMGIVGLGLILVSFAFARNAYASYVRWLQTHIALWNAELFSVAPKTAEFFAIYDKAKLHFGPDDRAVLEQNKGAITQAHEMSKPIITALDRMIQKHEQVLSKMGWWEIALVIIASVQSGVGETVLLRMLEG